MRTRFGMWVLALVFTASAQAASEVRLWHALSPHNQAVLDQLVTQFNKSQKDIKLSASRYASTDALEAALNQTKTPPHLVQLDEPRTRDGSPKRADIQPLYRLLERYPIQDQDWFVARQYSAARDAQGRLLAFPLMLEVPVMLYNQDAFARAGVRQPPNRAWSALQAELVTLANNGSRQCPLISDQVVSVNLENLAAVNNLLYTSDDNGMRAGAKDATFAFDVAYVRHLSMMISWVRSELMVRPQFSVNAVERFAQGECAVLITDSGSLGALLQQKNLHFSVVGLPYYPQLTPKPGNPFVSGGALWSVRGHPAAEEQAVSTVLGWLAQAPQAAFWHQNTGFLPLTDKAFAATPAPYYAALGQWRALIQVYTRNPERLNRGFRVHNYPAIRRMFRETLDRSLSGDQPAMMALRSAQTRASQIMRQP